MKQSSSCVRRIYHMREAIDLIVTINTGLALGFLEHEELRTVFRVMDVIQIAV
jgi:lipoprotein signal peptidase